MTDAVVPSWEGVHERRLARLARVDVKLVIAVLIGLVSVTGAFITWKSSQLGEKATDQDRLAIAETVLQEQNNADVENQLRDEQQAFVQFKSDLTNARLLDTEADDLAKTGLNAEAAQARDEAAVLREVANNRASLTFDQSYVDFDEDTGVPTEFRTDDRRQDLRNDPSNEAAKVDPDRTAEQAADYRRRTQRLEGWTIALVLAVVLLTLATITRNVRARPWLASVAVVIYIASTSIALIGD
jgi:hypothetical protein